MSRILNDVKRSLNVQPKAPAPAPADTAGLGDAIAQVIRAQVAEQVADAVEKQRPYINPQVPPHRRDFTNKAPSGEWPDPPPRTAPPKDFTVHLQRNEVGRVKSVSIGKINFVVMRNADGQLIGMKQEDN